MKKNQKDTALLIVDVQNGLIDDKPWQIERVLDNIQQLLAKFRVDGREVVYIQHTDEELPEGSREWEIATKIAAKPGEAIFLKKYNSAFYKTGLEDHLREKGIDTLVLVGMQTEYCIDATVKSAFERDIALIIPEDANTTYDNEYLPAEKLHAYYNYKIWNNRFGKVVKTEDLHN